MRKLFTILSAMLLAVSAFAATEQAWYNDVTSITANGQYYIYSVKGKGFMQAGQSKVKAVTTSNYTSNSDLIFTVTKANDGKAYNGSNYISSYQLGTCGPTGKSSDDGSQLIWTSMSSGSYWNIHGHYTAWLSTRWAALYYDGSYAATANVGIASALTTYTEEQYRWYLISPAQYDRHFAIYFFDAYKETVTDYTQYNGLVPAAYYTALENAYGQTFSVQNAAHSAEVVNAAKANLETLYTGAADIAAAYATATAAINALEAIEDKGEDFAEVTTDINNARTALEAAMTVDAVEASVAGLKAIDPISFNKTTFEALTMVNGAASSVAGRTISYAAVDNAIINAEGKAIYAGTTTLTATAAATDQYYKFVRSAQVTVTAWETFGEFEQTTCDEAVEFNNQTYEESFADDVNVGENYLGGDSIVHVNIVINHATFGTDTKTIVYGDEEEWNGIALKDSTVGVHSVVYVTTNAVGCDSTVTLTLTVNKIETLEVPVELSFCEGGSVWYRETEYTEAGQFEIEAAGETRDTLYVVNVTVLQPDFTEEEMIITVGKDTTWNGIALKDSTVGTHYVVYATTNVAGCDSTVTLTLTVNKMDTLKTEYEIEICEGSEQTYRGVIYNEEGRFTLDVIEGETRDTLLTVVVTVNPKGYEEIQKTDTIGNVIELPEGEWTLGDEVVSGSYEIQETDIAGLEFVQIGVTEKGCEAVTKWIVTVEEKKPEQGGETTGFENAQEAQKAIKEFRNGVLYIRRGEKVYTTSGELVK